MKVYVVTAGFHYETHVIKVFSNEDKAKEYVEFLEKTQTYENHGFNGAQYEQLELD